MAIIDVVEWSPTENDIFAWRFPESNLSTATQLIVRESQEAVFFSKGQILGKFGSGKHQLSTENLPLLRRLYGIPFGGKNPFFAEVWFVNKAMPLNIDWRTTSMRYMDPQYQAMVPLVATGRYGIKIVDAEKFLVKLNGTKRQFSADDLTDHFMGPLTTKTNSTILSFMNANCVGITQIAMQLDQLSAFLREPMNQFWHDYGLELVGFYITSIDVDTDTPDGSKIAQALSDRSAQNIAGYTWQQQRAFEAANNASNGGGMGGMLGAAMIMGMIGGGGGAGFNQGMMQPPQQIGYGTGPGFGQQPPQQTPISSGMQSQRQVFCANCARKFDGGSAFCPHCGHRYNPCPVCGSDNQDNARRCVRCGATLPLSPQSDTICPRCSKQVRIGLTFCPQCGERLG